ncbi:MAG: hypothetical protein Q4A97_03475 [Comamonadaceae bacterium]|nr:hypothetical protein [Comamonadaceae bacterium]
MKRLLTSLFVLLAITAVVFYGMFSTLKSKKPNAPAAVTAPASGAQGPR